MPISLPTAPTPATRTNPKLLVIYGPPKVGKTTILSKLQDCLIVDCEAGSDHLTALKLRADSISEFREICYELINRKKPYKYLAIDTVDALEAWCEVDATLTYKTTAMGKSFSGNSVLELPMGGGYFWLRQSFNKHISLLLKASNNLILVGHVRDSVIQATGQQEVQAKSLDLTGKIRNMVCSMADAIAYMSRNAAGKITLNFKTRDLITCGGRCHHLIDKELEFTDWKQIYIEGVE